MLAFLIHGSRDARRDRGAYLVLAVVAFGAAGRDIIDEAWCPPFPSGLMTAVGIGLAVLAAAWLVLRDRGLRGLGILTVVGVVAGLVVGMFGLWGTSQIFGDRCSDLGATAMLAYSLPPGDCASALPSLLVGGYLMEIGIASVVSLAQGSSRSRF